MTIVMAAVMATAAAALKKLCRRSHSGPRRRPRIQICRQRQIIADKDVVNTKIFSPASVTFENNLSPGRKTTPSNGRGYYYL
jgi:hypothetical protein